MISLLIPTRRRRGQLERMINSARATAVGTPLEFVCYVDDDDRHTYETLSLQSIDCSEPPTLVMLYGPRTFLSDCWNRCAQAASGDILLQANDDIIFRTVGWDKMVSDAFSCQPDHMLMVHGSDGGRNAEDFGPHPFIHRDWVDALGYFTAPYFSSDYGDSWINDLANGIGRRRYMNFLIEHMHFIFGKAAIDETTSDRLARHSGDNVEILYQALAPLRRLDVAKLQRVIAGLEKPVMKWSILILTQPSRAGYLSRLLLRLEPQLANYPDAELNVRMFDKTMDLGTNRQAMIEGVKGEYVNFIDDDDMIPENYVSKIYPLLDGIDYVGFKLQMSIDGVSQKPTFHSLRYPNWNGDNNGWYRDISHLNPIRRELAVTVKMSGGNGEDARWADALRAKDIIKKEHFVNEVMYFYQFRTNKNDQHLPQPQPPLPPGQFFPIGHRRPECPKCKSTSCGIGGGLRICNQCGTTWT